MTKQSLSFFTILVVIASCVGWFLVREVEKITYPIDEMKSFTCRVLKKSGELERYPIDVSQWRTYQHEKYGFEIQLPEEFSIKQNLQNIDYEKFQSNLNAGKSDEESFVLLNTKNEYVFSSKSGLKMLLDSGLMMGDMTDGSRLYLRIYPYSKLAGDDFGKWAEEKFGDAVVGMEMKNISMDRKIPFVSWASMCGDYSGFFVSPDKKFILELRTCGPDTLFTETENDHYFSKILNSVKY